MTLHATAPWAPALSRPQLGMHCKLAHAGHPPHKPRATSCMSTAQSQAHPSSLLLSSTVMALRRLAETPPPLPDPRTADARLQLTRATQQLVHMDPQQLVDVVWAAGKVSRTRSLRNACRSVQDTAMLWYMAAVRADNLQPSIEHVNKLWTGLGATRRALDASWNATLQQALLAQLTACTPHELAGVACAWGATGMQPQPAVLSKHGQCVMECLSDMGSQDLAKIMWAWASIGRLPTTVSFASVSDRALGMLDRCTTWELSVILFAHARFRHAPDDVVGYLLRQRLYQGGLDDLNLQAVPGLLVSAAKLGIALPPSRVDECLASVARHGSARHVAQCVWAQCVMCAANPEGLRASLPRMLAAVSKAMDASIQSGSMPPAEASLLLQSDAAVRCMLGGVEDSLFALERSMGMGPAGANAAPQTDAACARLLDDATRAACHAALARNPPRARQRVTRARARLAAAAVLLPNVAAVDEAYPVVDGLFTVDVLCRAASNAPCIAFDIVVREQCFSNAPAQPMGHRVFRSRLVQASEGMAVVGVPLEELEAAENKLAVVDLLQRRMFAAGL